jgi:hypothetical protein
LAVGSWQLAVGSWQLAVGSWQLAVGKKYLKFQTAATECLLPFIAAKWRINQQGRLNN